MSKQIVLDVQGFKTSNKVFSPKELAVYDGFKTAHYIFKPPFRFNCLNIEFQKQANYLMHNHHGILWESGFTPSHKFSDIVKHITSSADVVYIKGREKTLFIKTIISKPIVELDEQPKLPIGEPYCFNHSLTNCICALTNVFHLYNNFIMHE